ncbi:MAG: helix-turn-helix transcriptional regulator [Clostridia bacterium]|nr:helix-turn-helix transcriptional regulator [Clostridia bacterium]
MNEKQTFYKIPKMLKVESFFTSFIRYYDGDYRFEGEMHDFWEFTYVFDGSASVAKDDKVYVLNKGEIVFHKPMEFHRLWGNGKPFSVLVISFEAKGNVMEKLADSVYTLNLSQHNSLMDIKRDIDNTYNVDRITLYTDGSAPLSLNTIALKFELFLLELIKLGASEKKAESSVTSQEFSKIVNVMYSNLDRDLSVEAIAELCNIGVSNLKKICHKYAGVGPAKHFLRLKITHAVRLLENGISVTEVSEALGFSSQSYFSVVFKRETGRSPGEMKRKNN